MLPSKFVTSMHFHNMNLSAIIFLRCPQTKIILHFNIALYNNVLHTNLKFDTMPKICLHSCCCWLDLFFLFVLCLAFDKHLHHWSSKAVQLDSNIERGKLKTKKFKTCIYWATGVDRDAHMKSVSFLFPFHSHCIHLNRITTQNVSTLHRV